MSEFILTTTFLCEDVEITITQSAGNVDLDITHVDGGVPDVAAGASLTPKFAQKLGAALQSAGYDADWAQEDDTAPWDDD